MKRQSGFCTSGGVSPCPGIFKLPENPAEQFVINRRFITRDLVLHDNIAHWHDFIQIWYSPKNNYVHSIFNREQPISTGGLCIVPPYYSHDLSPLSRDSFEVVALDLSVDFLNNILPNESDRALFLNPLLSSSTVSPVFYFTGSAKYEIELLFDCIFTEYQKNKKNAWWFTGKKLFACSR